MRTTATVDYQDSTAAVIRHDARGLPFDDGTVDLIVTSPPYFALRSYRDGGEHYDGQIGSEATPLEFVDALTECMVEWRRVLKPSGSVWINLGDKYAGTGGANSNTGLGLADSGDDVTDSRGSARNNTKQTRGFRAKSLIGIPWRFAIAQIDAGWILRAEVVWSKPNGLPESVTDRVRRSHEQWFHFVKEPRYYSAIDEIREPSNDGRPQRARANELAEGLSDEQVAAARAVGVGDVGRGKAVQNGVNSDETYRLAAEAREVLGGYFREFIGGGLGRVPGSVWTIPIEPLTVPDDVREAENLPDHFAAFPQEWPRRIILGWSPKGGLVVDPFGGTGTVAGVARTLNRYGISNDLSADYNRLAIWRIWHSGHFTKTEQRTWADRQQAML